MNKQEVIETLQSEAINHYNETSGWTKKIELDIAIDIVNQLNEPEKPVVPQFVADWYEEHIGGDFEYNLYLLYVDYYEQKLEEDLKKWIGNGSKNKSIQTLVNMHQFGYEVEKEKLYLASFRDTDQYLGWNEKLGEWFVSCSPFTDGVEQTQETWEGVEIWDNPAFEIVEVEE